MVMASHSSKARVGADHMPSNIYILQCNLSPKCNASSPCVRTWASTGIELALGRCSAVQCDQRDLRILVAYSIRDDPAGSCPIPAQPPVVASMLPILQCHASMAHVRNSVSSPFSIIVTYSHLIKIQSFIYSKSAAFLTVRFQS